MDRTAPPTRFAEASGIELAYDSFGDPNAPPLLLIMGLGTQMIAWDVAFCGRLADRGYHVIRFDNRDIGQSTRSATPACRCRQAADAGDGGPAGQR